MSTQSLTEVIKSLEDKLELGVCIICDGATVKKTVSGGDPTFMLVAMEIQECNECGMDQTAAYYAELQKARTAANKRGQG